MKKKRKRKIDKNQYVLDFSIDVNSDQGKLAEVIAGIQEGIPDEAKITNAVVTILKKEVDAKSNIAVFTPPESDPLCNPVFFVLFIKDRMIQVTKAIRDDNFSNSTTYLKFRQIVGSYANKTVLKKLGLLTIDTGPRLYF